MPAKCFKKNDSNPPVCGVHNVKLVERREVVAGVGKCTFFVCPMSNQVVDDAPSDTPPELKSKS